MGSNKGLVFLLSTCLVSSSVASDSLAVPDPEFDSSQDCTSSAARNYFNQQIDYLKSHDLSNPVFKWEESSHDISYSVCFEFNDNSILFYDSFMDKNHSDEISLWYGSCKTVSIVLTNSLKSKFQKVFGADFFDNSPYSNGSWSNSIIPDDKKLDDFRLKLEEFLIDYY